MQRDIVCCSAARGMLLGRRTAQLHQCRPSGFLLHVHCTHTPTRSRGERVGRQTDCAHHRQKISECPSSCLKWRSHIVGAPLRRANSSVVMDVIALEDCQGHSNKLRNPKAKNNSRFLTLCASERFEDCILASALRRASRRGTKHQLRVCEVGTGMLAPPLADAYDLLDMRKKSSLVCLVAPDRSFCIDLVATCI